jgi:F0F1-type ATP synthase beta subunit
MTQTACAYPTAEWLTFKQTRELGGSIRKGEHGTHIFTQAGSSSRTRRHREMNAFAGNRLITTTEISVLTSAGGLLAETIESDSLFIDRNILRYSNSSNALTLSKTRYPNQQPYQNTLC